MNHCDALTEAWLQTLMARVPPCWMDHVGDVVHQPFFWTLRQRIAIEAQSHTVVPPPHRVMRALCETPYADVRAVIIGQDPYHGDGLANGLCFSVDAPHKSPPSLRNILAEYHADTGYRMPDRGDLLPWARAGVLLINAIWTTRSGVAGAHRAWGWEQWTKNIVRALQHHDRSIVFVLWGKDALAWRAHIDTSRHGVVVTPHPSPLSAHRGFFGSKPFGAVNAWLVSRGAKPIAWRLDQDLQ